ncbi:hypothetical protein [Sphingobium sp. SYK-6]|uniref:hypothetical protein n=1 Tax=Sphingobium sp. (strain NBRC 103272 / SYK-6) TaxID=627192 RepID=UPI0011D1987E|nr:hypothetical protein [Sphingobium sp. SYK-6]
MQASKRERVILYGVVPIAATIIGVVGTVIAQRLFGTDETVRAISAIANDPTMSSVDKLKAIDLVNKGSQQFYDFLRSTFSLLLVPLGVISIAVSGWINRR